MVTVFPGLILVIISQHVQIQSLCVILLRLTVCVQHFSTRIYTHARTVSHPRAALNPALESGSLPVFGSQRPICLGLKISPISRWGCGEPLALGLPRPGNVAWAFHLGLPGPRTQELTEPRKENVTIPGIAKGGRHRDPWTVRRRRLVWQSPPPEGCPCSSPHTSAHPEPLLAPGSAQTWQAPRGGKRNVGFLCTAWHRAPLRLSWPEKGATGLSRKIPNRLRTGARLHHLPAACPKSPACLMSRDGEQSLTPLRVYRENDEGSRL